MQFRMRSYSNKFEREISVNHGVRKVRRMEKNGFG